MNLDAPTLRQVSERFLMHGDFVVAERYGTGHINDSFAVTFDQGGERVRYLLQRLNTQIFKAPRDLMSNVVGVTDHIRAKLQREGLPSSQRVLTLIPVQASGESFLDDPVLGFWRCYFYQHQL